mmetsp:Transcript_117864/g.328283  ORF Transcript_117864/g.328283 Transcript_117864/m.328283 type:complete len:351 (-) Transcript_117864:879-1931(-)
MSSSICSSDLNSKYFLGVGSFFRSSRSYSSRVLSRQNVRTPRLPMWLRRACWLHIVSLTVPDSSAFCALPPSLEPLARGSPWPSDEPSRCTSSSLLGALRLDAQTSDVSPAVDIVEPALWPLSYNGRSCSSTLTEKANFLLRRSSMDSLLLRCCSLGCAPEPPLPRSPAPGAPSGCTPGADSPATSASSSAAAPREAGSPSGEEWPSSVGAPGGTSERPCPQAGERMPSISLGPGSSSVSSPRRSAWDCWCLSTEHSEPLSPLPGATSPPGATSGDVSSTRRKYLRVLLPLSSITAGGRPKISTMRQTWLYSEWPGKMGRPRKSSAQMQPRLHMSMALVYGRPSSTSGER